jgi:hypothetical protein
MLGRLFDLLLFAAAGIVLVRALLAPAQRQALHGFFKVLAFALLASSAIMVMLSLSGWLVVH